MSNINENTINAYALALSEKASAERHLEGCRQEVANVERKLDDAMEWASTAEKGLQAREAMVAALETAFPGLDGARSLLDQQREGRLATDTQAALRAIQEANRG